MNLSYLRVGMQQPNIEEQKSSTAGIPAILIPLPGIPVLIITITLLASCGKDHEPADDRLTDHHTLPALAPSPPLYVDYDRNVYIPAADDLVRPLKVAFSYNSDSVRVHFRYATQRPSWYHQYLVYESGEWIRYGGGSPGPDPHGLYEDRISMMLDDGSVQGFAQLGGFVTAHPGMRSLTDEVSGSEVANQTYLGDYLGRSDVRKFIQESRDGDSGGNQWQQIRDKDELEGLRDSGIFIDLWQWRAHRSNPLGYAVNGYVLDYRHSSEGTGMYTDNRDDEGNPRFMFDPEITGRYALRKDSLIDRHYGQSDPYFIYEGNAVPFNPDHDWQEGDAIPQRFLRQPDGSRGALKADGYWDGDFWNLTITRTMAAPNPRDSKAIEQGGLYHAAFSVHANASGARWHYVSVPFSIGFGTQAEIEATFIDDPFDDAKIEWTEIPVFYPGQIDYSWLISPDHPGNAFIEEGGMHMLQIHQLERLTQYIIRHELEMLGENPQDHGLDTPGSYY